MGLALLSLAALVTVGAASSVAASSKGSELRLVVMGEHEAVPAGEAFPYGIRHRGTFTAGAPLCPSGTFVDLENDLLNGSDDDSRLFTCADGSGSITASMNMFFEHKPPFTDSWRISEGTGRYAGLRGRGTYHGELISGDPSAFDPLTEFYRNELRGTAAFDAVAPIVTVTSAKATKVRRPTGTYSIRVAFSVRDDLAENGISYFVAADPGGGRIYLAEKTGSTTAKAAVTLRITPTAGTRKILLELRAQDAVGNRRVITRSLQLPR